MTTVNQLLAKLDVTLLNPKPQRPTSEQRFTQLAFQLGHLYNELTNTNQPWAYNSTTVNVTPGTQSYAIPGSIGKVLFVHAQTDSNVYGPVGLEFADLAEISSDYYLFSPLDYGYSRDFNENIPWGFPAQIAFYRNSAGMLYFRLAPFTSGIQSVTIVHATGDWANDLDPEAEPILSQHHPLAIVRAAKNLLPGSEWSQDRATILTQREQLRQTYIEQEVQFEKAWVIAKRSMYADDQPVEREAFGGNW